MTETQQSETFLEGSGKPGLFFLPEVMEAQRRKLELSQKQLAERAYMTQAQISALEVSNGTMVPGGKNLYWLARALELEMEDLLSERPPD